MWFVSWTFLETCGDLPYAKSRKCAIYCFQRICVLRLLIVLFKTGIPSLIFFSPTCSVEGSVMVICAFLFACVGFCCIWTLLLGTSVCIFKIDIAKCLSKVLYICIIIHCVYIISIYTMYNTYIYVYGNVYEIFPSAIYKYPHFPKSSPALDDVLLHFLLFWGLNNYI